MSKIVKDLIRELNKERQRLCLSRAQIARWLKVPEHTIYRWEIRIHSPSPVHRRAIRKLLQAIQEVEEEVHKMEAKNE